jgi:hypothetical protein
MFWRQKRAGRAREDAVGPILTARPAGTPRPETAQLARREDAGSAEEKGLMMRLLSTAPAPMNPLPTLGRAAAPSSLPADAHGAVWTAGQHEHEGGTAWHTLGPR